MPRSWWTPLRFASGRAQNFKELNFRLRILVAPNSRGGDEVQPVEKLIENSVVAKTRVQAVTSKRNSTGLFADK